MNPEEKLVREPCEVLIYMEHCKIRGTIYLPIGSRLSDYINDRSIQFIPITDVKVEFFDPKNKWSYDVDFMNINKDYIVSIFPIEK